MQQFLIKITHRVFLCVKIANKPIKKFWSSFIAAFSLQKGGAKKKLTKRNAEGFFRRLRATRMATRPPPRKLLKKLEQNF